MKHSLSYVLMIFCIVLTSFKTVNADSDASIADTVILASVDDPYYPLAEEISTSEGIPIYHMFDEAAKAKPVFLLWIISPAHLSESVLVDFSTRLNQLDTSISIGIFSGKTIEDARGLWKGSSQILISDYAIINGTKENKIEPQILSGGVSQPISMELSKENILKVMQSADALQISLEGAAGSWFDQSRGILVKSADIPALGSTIIQNYGCSTFKPWEKNSIALETINKGAVAYCGFVYPSVAGTRFGDYTDISTLYTWKNFPLGHLVQIQNRASMQSYAKLPHYFMLGDPRIYSNGIAPYQIISDVTDNEKRIIKLNNVKSGLIPIYIKDGAGYQYINIPGLSSSTMNNANFNSRIQMMDINNDKFVVIDNESDTITIEMNTKAPFLKVVFDNFINFLDSVFAASLGSSQPLVVSVPLVILFAIGVIRKRYSGKQLIAALIFGTFAAIVSLAYFSIRANQVTVTNIPIKINGWFIAGIFIFSGYGEILYSNAKNLKGKFVAILAANLNVVFTLLIFTGGLLIKQIVVGDTFSINKTGYPWLFTLKELLLGMAIFFTLYNLFNRLPLFQRKIKPASKVEKT